MANKVNATIVNDGAVHLVMHVYIESDGVSGDLSNEILLDPIDIGKPASNRFVIERVDYNFSGFSGVIGFESELVDKTLIWTLNEGNSLADFKLIGGLADRSGIDGSGKIQISTNGLSAGDNGTMIIHIRK